MRLVVLLAALIHCASAYDVDVKKLEGLARARVEVESGYQYRKSFFFKKIIIIIIIILNN